ncbi:MAG: efflux RND transporter periplasmic adaptor subunit, partial [Phycisphaerae bacterium]|nr:efflux RND transporter periplasmic adaptor subunit [Phycisphaerae bacterium]
APRAARKRRWPVVAFLVAAGVVAAVVLLPTRQSDEMVNTNAIGAVEFGQLTISVDGDEGEVKPGEFRLLSNELEGKSTIISMVDPGTQVKKGQTILELDASSLKDAKVDQEISVQLAQAAFVRSRETLGVIEKQNESNIKIATLNLEFAKLDVTKYVEGDYPQQLRNARSAIKLSEAEAEDAKQVHEWSKKLFGRGYVTQTDLNRDKLARDRREIDLEAARGSLELLEKYEHKRELAQVHADVDAKELALLLAQHKAASNMVDGQADLKAKEIKLKREQEKLAKTELQIAKSTIIAPIDGMVLYIDDRYDGIEGLAVGSSVRERQHLVRLPTTSKLLAELKVHESQLRKIKVGMPVEITTDAVANKTFWGRLQKIAVMPDSTHRYGNPYLKVYATTVEFTGDTRGLRPGMSCKGRVIVDQFKDVAYVPIQAVVQEDDESVVYTPGPDGPVRRRVEVGLDNNIHVIVTRGLARGEKILLAPNLSNSYVRQRQAPPVVPKEVNTAQSPPASVDDTLDGRGAESSEAARAGKDGRGPRRPKKPRRSDI